METIQLTLLRIISTITRSWRFMWWWWWWVSSISSILATQKNACREEYQRCYRYEEEECSYGFGRAWLLNLHFICLPCRPCLACMVVNVEWYLKAVLTCTALKIHAIPLYNLVDVGYVSLSQIHGRPSSHSLPETFYCTHDSWLWSSRAIFHIHHRQLNECSKDMHTAKTKICMHHVSK